LIVGSVLALERDILLRSFAGYVPAILGGLFVAMLFGIVCGAIFGIKPADTIIKYTLPIMGGGNGAGAVPLSQIYEQITGDSAANYYSFAIIVLTIANLFCIIASAGLNALGQKIPALTGDKKTLIRKGGTITRDDTKVKVTTDDLMGAVLLACACYSFGLLKNSSKDSWCTNSSVCVHDRICCYSCRKWSHSSQCSCRCKEIAGLYVWWYGHRHYGWYGC